MKLEKLILVNWGALRTDEYPMGNMTLLTGQTGTGKSTMLDAMQTVMTAAYQGIFSYNPGQDETSQSSRNGKSKRTLWSYIAGGSDNLFVRPTGAHGYIAAVFKPSEGEDGKTFTALVAASARVEGTGNRRQAVQEKLALLIIDDATLCLEDLTDIQPEVEMSVVPVEKIYGHLKSKFAHVTNFRDVKRDYLSALYGRFRGQSRPVSFPEAELAARAWSQSIAAKEIGSVDELVKTQILDHDTQQLAQRITQISDLMRQVSNLRADGERMKANITRLDHIAEASDKAAVSFEKHLQFHALQSKRSLREDDLKREDSENKIVGINRQIASEQADSAAFAAEKDKKTDSKVKILAQLSGIPAADQKRRIEEDLAKAHGKARTIIATLLASIGAAEALQRIARQIVGFDYPAAFGGLSGAAGAVGRALAHFGAVDYTDNVHTLNELANSEDMHPGALLAQSTVFKDAGDKFADLYAAIAGHSNSFVASLHTQLADTRAAIAEAAKREGEAAARKASLASGGADYPGPTKHTMSRLRAEFPACNPQVLCDLIEPVDTKWQASIEGYMGGARFSILVDPSWEARTIDFMRKENLGGKIVQGSLCLKHAKDVVPSPDSIIHELTTEHPIAKAYLADLYGRVVKVKDADELRYTTQGVTLDGRASGGRTMFVVKKEPLVFGKEAQRLARERAEEEHARVEQELRTYRAEQESLQQLLAVAGKAARPDFSAAIGLPDLASTLETAAADLARLDLSEVKELEAQGKALDLEIKGLEARIRDSDKLVGDYQSTIRQHNAEIERLTTHRPAKFLKFKGDEYRLQNLCMVNGALSLTTLMNEVDGMLESGGLSFTEIQTRAQNLLVTAQSYFGDVREFLAEYNQHARPEERLDIQTNSEVRNEDFAPLYAQLIGLRRKAHELLSNQRGIGLVKNLDQLRNAEESFKDVFTKQFCYEIRNSVDIGVKTLRSLNNELEKLKFGTDKFKIDWSEWVPEYKAYYDFFCAAYDLSESREADSLFTCSELSAENCKVRDQLVNLLLSDDQEFALKELQRIADYRNYRRYEIWKESDTGSRVALSEWGTGSGGELETPAYIIRAAVVTNRLKHFEKGMKLKLMVNDESFARMDERRAHDVMSFMRDNLGMQLICAMPTMKAGALKPAFNKEWCFSRTDAANGELDYVSEGDERTLNPDKLAELWEARRVHVRDQAKIQFEDTENTPA